MAMAEYTVYLLNNPDAGLQPLLQSKAADLGLPPSAITFETSYRTADTAGLAAGIFWGTSTSPDAIAVDSAQALVLQRLPIFPVHHGNFTHEIPACLNSVNGFHSSRGLDDLANSVLESLQLLRRRRRLFVSYLRKEATALALQLYDAFDGLGYDVFFDSKSLLPGCRFQEELTECLADSDLVVFLHSPGVGSSQWVAYERGVAEKLGIHVVEVLWPGKEQSPASGFQEPFEWQPGEQIETSVHVGAEEMRQPRMSASRLKDLLQIVAKIRSRALAERRRRVAGSLLDLAAHEQIEHSEEPPNKLKFQLSAQDKIQLTIECGLPDARDLERTEAAAAGCSVPAESGLLYDGGSLTADSRRHLNWLKSFCPVGAYDVNQLLESDLTVKEWLQQNQPRVRAVRPVFLSASIPYPKSDPGVDVTAYCADTDRDAIREAVLALVRVVLPRTQLYYGGHPAITPFVAQVALEAGEARLGRVKVFQSDRWRGFYPPENRAFRDIEFVMALGDESKADSLKRMRDAMLQKGTDRFFSAAFFIGGMNGVEDEYRLMRSLHPEVPCFPVATTGAAARMLWRELKPEFPLERKYWAELGASRLYGSLFRRILVDLARITIRDTQ